MKFSTAILGLATAAQAFTLQSPSFRQSSSSLSMVLEKPKAKKLAKIETLKIDSDHLVKPLLSVSLKKAFCDQCNVKQCNEVMQYILSPSDRYMSTAKKGPVPQASGRFG